MNLIQRRRLFFGLLVVLACWPLGHLLLVERYLINPWELSGFSMYVQPNTSIEVRVVDSSGEILAPQRLSAEAFDAYSRYRNQATVLGLLAPTDELARALQRSDKNDLDLNIELRRRVIDSSGNWTYKIGKKAILQR